MSPIILRASRIDDAPEIATLFAYSATKAYEHILPPEVLSRYTPENQLERWKNHLNTLLPGHHIIVALTPESNQLLGFIEVGPSKQKSIGEVHYLFVLPALERRGVGTVLMQAGEQWLKEQGYKSGLLEVFCKNDVAKRFYRKEGWVDFTPPREEPQFLQMGYSIKDNEMRKEFSQN